ncbi:MAG: MBL fold metallo-hydrolase [Thermaerobacter sp.]|nr:MBL fold metallo-hydrolase [Thermaerobacter sp.]
MEGMIDALRQVPVPPGTVLLTRFGGAGLLLRTVSTTVLIDLYLGGDAAPGWVRSCPIPFTPGELGRLGPVAALFSTHEHMDHCYEPVIQQLGKAAGTIFVGPERSAVIAERAGFPAERVHRVRQGDRITVGDIDVEVYAFFDPGSPESLSYLFRTGTVTVFHAGDATLDSEMQVIARRHRVDVAFMSLARRAENFRGHMSAEEMAEAAMLVRPKRLVPMHYDLWEVLREDPQRVVAALRRRTKAITVLPMAQGDVLRLPDA